MSEQGSSDFLAVAIVTGACFAALIVSAAKRGIGSFVVRVTVTLLLVSRTLLDRSDHHSIVIDVILTAILLTSFASKGCRREDKLAVAMMRRRR